MYLCIGGVKDTDPAQKKRRFLMEEMPLIFTASKVHAGVRHSSLQFGSQLRFGRIDIILLNKLSFL